MPAQINDNGTIRDMTDAEIAKYDTVDSVKASKGSSLQIEYVDAISAGCAISGKAWRLSPADAELIAQDVTLIGLQLDIANSAQKTAILASNIDIPTTAGPQTVTVAEARVMYATFGAWMRALVLRLKTAQTTLTAATTREAINAITF